MHRALPLLLMALVTISYRCEDSDRPLTRAERAILDSLYRLEVKRLEQELDSLCEARWEALYAQMFDSIMQRRIQERQQLMERFKHDRR